MTHRISLGGLKIQFFCGGLNSYKLSAYYDLYIAASKMPEAIEVYLEQFDYHNRLIDKKNQYASRYHTMPPKISQRWREHTSFIPVCDAVSDLSIAKESFRLKIEKIDLEFKSKLPYENNDQLSVADCAGNIAQFQQEIMEYIDKIDLVWEKYAAKCHQ